MGGVLNEFDESNNNPHHGGLRLYLQNGATWRNEWLGAEREYPTQGRPDTANYLYTGSKVEHLIGGATEGSRGIIQAVDARPITINNYAGHTARMILMQLDVLWCLIKPYYPLVKVKLYPVLRVH